MNFITLSREKNAFGILKTTNVAILGERKTNGDKIKKTFRISHQTTRISNMQLEVKDNNNAAILLTQLFSAIVQKASRLALGRFS